MDQWTGTPVWNVTVEGREVLVDHEGRSNVYMREGKGSANSGMGGGGNEERGKSDKKSTNTIAFPLHVKTLSENN